MRKIEGEVRVLGNFIRRPFQEAEDEAPAHMGAVG
jgi:hypothetical protein